nr:MAG TPA: hypothetical protein [Caudoviricetes sp.]DAF30430.1 MAG TPA: hypothetical protein [Caudoviricetes sp.]
MHKKSAPYKSVFRISTLYHNKLEVNKIFKIK